MAAAAALRAWESGAGDAPALQALREAVVLHGLGPARCGCGRAACAGDGPCAGALTADTGGPSARARAWKALLGVGRVDHKRYLELVRRGEHPRLGEKIRNDTFRTFKNDAEFVARVPEARLVRVLNAFVHACEGDGCTYVQGMNVICGVFLFVMPELDAFYCFMTLAQRLAPSYVAKNLEGVKRGCALVEECLALLDPELARFLQHDLKTRAEIYAFAPVMTLSACCPPIDAVVRLWDVLFAAGVHLNIVFYASQLVLMRNELMSREDAGAVDVKQCLRGRDFPHLNADRLFAVAFPFLLRLVGEPELLDRIERHTQACPAPAAVVNGG